MRNYWVQKEDWLYAWQCSIAPQNVSLEALRDFAIAANELLESEQILDVQTFKHSSNLYSYDRKEHGTMARSCQRLFDEQHLLQLPSGNLQHENRCSTKVVYYDRRDELVEASVADLGVLLRDLDPMPGAILRYFRRRGHAPIEVTGAVVATSELATRSSVWFHLATHSNIWAPYLYWTGHPWGP